MEVIKKNDYNIGTLIIYAIIGFQKKYNNIINKEVNNINDNKINNYIIAEFETKEDNETIRIINSYEECCREYNLNVDEKKYIVMRKK